MATTSSPLLRSADTTPAETAAPSLEQQLQEAEERVLRVQAELENFRKRARREYDDAQRYREMQAT